MPIAAIRIYLEKCPGVKAERKILDFEAHSALWLDKFEKRNLLESWEAAAYGEREVQKVTRKSLGQIGLGVEIGSDDR